jgi:hypothetical protein
LALGTLASAWLWTSTLTGHQMTLLWKNRQARWQGRDQDEASEAHILSANIREHQKFSHQDEYYFKKLKFPMNKRSAF